MVFVPCNGLTLCPGFILLYRAFLVFMTTQRVLRGTNHIYPFIPTCTLVVVESTSHRSICLTSSLTTPLQSHPIDRAWGAVWDSVYCRRILQQVGCNSQLPINITSYQSIWAFPLFLSKAIHCSTKVNLSLLTESFTVRQEMAVYMLYMYVHCCGLRLVRI